MPLPLNEQERGRRALLDDALVAIEKAARGSNTIAAAAEAKRLFAAYPKARMSLTEIEGELSKLAAQRGVLVQSS
jgi:hypothetical protein